MTEDSVSATAIKAPAKLNLGLEVLGRRADGYHDLATIFLTVSLYDHLVFRSDPPSGTVNGGTGALSCESDAPELESGNLVLTALQRLQEATGYPVSAHVELQKSIPIASGLGGASSDAAAVLLAARQRFRIEIDDAALARVAASLGSDVPFLLEGGCALGTGRGDVLSPLPAPDCVQFVLVTPPIHIPMKTETLYRTLDAANFTDGSHVAAQAARLRAGTGLDNRLLVNAFSSPLYEIVTELASLPDTLTSLGAPVVALSGSGPTHYVPFQDPDQASAFALRATARFGQRTRIALVTPVPARAKSTP
ncbi:MAG: 4-(cytidine 5'-diphospho)-2-C-methyl-D-erythritol kinase [Thermomicrobiales bacterium]